jgi:hypothetical protein
MDIERDLFQKSPREGDGKNGDGGWEFGGGWVGTHAGYSEKYSKSGKKQRSLEKNIGDLRRQSLDRYLVTQYRTGLRDNEFLMQCTQLGHTKVPPLGFSSKKDTSGKNWPRRSHAKASRMNGIKDECSHNYSWSSGDANPPINSGQNALDKLP